MPFAAIMVSGYDPGYLAIFEHLVRSEVRAGRTPIVFDITALAATPVDSYHRGVLRRFGIAYPGSDIEQRMIALGAEYVDAASIVGHDNFLPLDEHLEALLDIAVQSALITFFRTDRPNLSRKSVRTTAENLRHEGRSVYRAATELCRRFPDLVTAYVPNGRFPHQRLAGLAFERLGVPRLHIEKGESPGRAYIQGYAPQDRIRSQDSVKLVLDGVSPDRLNEIADEWLGKRAPAEDSHNDFSSLWSDDVPSSVLSHKQAGSKIVGFFTSSQDEFQFLGPEWHLHEWKDQVSAFDQVLTRLEMAGYSSYLRVHPNLATKAHDCFIRERDSIRWLAKRHPSLSVIWHDDQTNTYSLLDVSDAVIVWYSTVGLEASARGLPVWTTATSRYGLVADVRELLSAEDLETNGLDLWQVDSERAKRFIAYLVLRDEEIETESSQWVSWDTQNPPLGVKLAAVAVSGGIPRPIAAILSLVDVYRHRRFSANIRALRGKLVRA